MDDENAKFNLKKAGQTQKSLGPPSKDQSGLTIGHVGTDFNLESRAEGNEIS